MLFESTGLTARVITFSPTKFLIDKDSAEEAIDEAAGGWRPKMSIMQTVQLLS